MPTVINCSTSSDKWEILFQSCLVMALADATMQRDAPEKTEAIRWFNDPISTPDIEEICDYAGVNPDYFLKKASLLLKRGTPVSRRAELTPLLESI